MSNAILEIIIDLISVMETSRRPTQQELDHPSVILTTMLSSCSQHTGHCSNPVTTVKVWSSNKMEELKGCFLCTDWDVFFEDNYINTATDTISACISFCTRGIRECIHKKNQVFKLKDKAGIRAALKDLNQQLRSARLQHKERPEQPLSNSNTKKLWDSIGGTTNMVAKKKALYALNESARANELNDFYLCFEVDSVS